MLVLLIFLVQLVQFKSALNMSPFAFKASIEIWRWVNM